MDRAVCFAGLPTKDNPAYSSLPFDVTVYNKDFYGQTLASDSSSFVQLLRVSDQNQTDESALGVSGTSTFQLTNGVATLSVAMEPVFSTVEVKALASNGTARLASPVYSHFTLVDATSGTRFLSPLLEIPFSTGATVCPPGFFLQLSSFNVGGCVWCQPGTYSVSPLAASKGIRPSCLNCPADGLCLGGNKVEFRLGEWIIANEGAMYRLKSCPDGYELINSINGVFEHDIQRCSKCQSNEYVLDSSNSFFSCTECPVGATCDGTSLHPKTAGEVWEADMSRGIFLLKSCPAGYQMIATDSNGQFSYVNQHCDLCSAGFYCVGGSVAKAPCPQGQFSPPGSLEKANCTTVSIVQVSVSLPLAAAEFTKDRQQRFVVAMAKTAGCATSSIVIENVYSSRRAGASLVVDTKIATQDQSAASALVKNFDPAKLNSELVQQGLPQGTLISLGVVSSSPSDSGARERLLTTTLASVLGGVTLLFLAMLGVLWQRGRRQDSQEQKLLNRTIVELRARLHIRREDHHLLSSERPSMWTRQKDAGSYIIIQKNQMDAAARLALLQDFDLYLFDAFCLGLECEARAVSPQSNYKSLRNFDHDLRTEQYAALCEWLLDMCSMLVKPHCLMISTEPDTCPLRFEERFPYFMKKVIRARIWTDHSDFLFQKLKKIAGTYMSAIEQSCSLCFDTMCQQPEADALISYSYRPNSHYSNGAPIMRQDDAQVSSHPVNPFDVLHSSS